MAAFAVASSTVVPKGSVLVGAHSAARKNAKAWLVPAVGTAVAVTGQGLVVATNAGASTATTGTTSSVGNVAPGSGLGAAPSLQPGNSAFAALAKSYKAKKPMATPRLTSGMKSSSYVLYVQKKLGVVPWNAKLGKTEGAGFFGPRTKAAVLRFQHAKGLDALGSVGPNTWRTLLNVGDGKAYKFRAAKVQKKSSASSSGSTYTAPRASRGAARKPVAQVSSTSRVTKVLSIAKSLSGSRYVYGGTTTSGFDCSGFVGWVYRQVGVSLPRTSRQIHDAVTPISASSVRPGDLFFVKNSSGSIYHVGIIGEGGYWLEARNSREDVGAFRPWADSGDLLYGRV